MTTNGQRRWETEEEEALAAQLERVTCQRDAALQALDGVTRVIEEVGGVLKPTHQEKLLDAKFILETTGTRTPSRRWGR